MELSVQSMNKSATSKLTVADSAFACDYNEGLAHQIITAYMAAGRAGTKAQKNRSDVSGGGKKPWRQKGTGRARAGTTRSPLWRSGGVTFAARPRDYSQKVNRKMMRKAMAGMLSELFRLDRVTVIDAIEIKEPKTKLLTAALKQLNAEQALIVIAEENTNLTLASRNIPNVLVKLASKINPVDLIAFDKVLMTQDAVKKIEERLA